MQKVITINLNGRAYQLDEDAYALLSAYFDRSRQALEDNPDLSEIMSDLEQAIAEKCQRFLGPHKSVVQAAEIAQVLEEMGPVDGVDGAATEPAPGTASNRTTGTNAPPAHDTGAPKRLYLIQDGAWIGGVCNGIAAFFNVDVMIIRVVFIAFAGLTKGAGSMVYALLWFTLPPASTSEEEAAAHGVPFNAKEIVEQAKAKAHAFAEEAVKQSHAFSGDWKAHSREWRREQRRWRREARAERRRARRAGRTWGTWGSTWGAWAGPQSTMSPGSPGAPGSPVAAPVGYAGQVTAGILVPVLTLVSAGLFWIWAAAMMSLFTTGAIFGRALPADLPLWAAFLILFMLFSMLSMPIQHARHASHAALGGRYYYGGVAAWDSMMGVGFWLLCGWAVWTYIPEVRQFIHDLPIAGDRFREIFRTGAR